MLKNKPFTLLNYIEGTRFTPAKRDAQNAPYTHLLKPRAGGLALAINALGDEIDGILDMTIVYPDGIPTYSDLWKGNIKRLGVEVRYIDIPKQLLIDMQSNDYQTSTAIKEQFFAWVDKAWQAKDQRITEMLADFEKNPENDTVSAA